MKFSQFKTKIITAFKNINFFQSRKAVGVTLIIVAVLTVGSFYVWGYAAAGGVNIQISSPADVVIGEPFDLKVSFMNDSGNPLNNSNLSLELPEGLVPLNAADSKKILNKNIGIIAKSGFHQETFKVMAVPARNPKLVVRVTLSYSLGTISANFKKAESYELSAAPLEADLNLTAPTTVFSGEQFEIKGDYKGDNTGSSEKLFLRTTYPSQFSKISEQITAITDTSGKLVAKGKASLSDNSSFVVKAQILVSLMGREYVITEKDITITVSPSPLSLRISLNNVDNYIANPGDTLNYSLVYKNNTDVPLQNIQLSVKLTGQMFDFGSLNSTGGNFNSLNRTIVWTAGSLPDLQILNPGEEKTIQLSVKVRPDYPIKKLNDKNFTLKAEANIQSPTVPHLVEASSTVNFASVETKVAGKISIQTVGLFRDAEAGIVNKGPWPPKVGEDTQFTIHLVLTNYSSDLSNVEVRASLQDGVIFTNAMKSNTTDQPQIDEEAGQIIWKIQNLVATSGITGQSPEAIFQVEVNPTPDKVGNYMPLIDQVQVKATDDFTGQAISVTGDAVDTRLPGDKTVSENQGRIVQ